MSVVKTGVGLFSLVILIGCDGYRSVAPDQALSLIASKRGSSGSAPSELYAGALPGAIGLSWLDNAPNETGFIILRSSSGAAGAFAAIATTGANVTTYSDSPLAPQREYCYQVQAVGHNGAIGTSNTACATTLPLPPSAAYSVSATLVNIWDIAVSWQDSSSSITGYRLERASTPTGPWATLATFNGNTNFLDQHIPVEQQQCYRVFAFNGSGDSQPSNVSCSALPAPPTSVVAYSNDGHTITVTWTDASLYEDGYEIQRCCGVNLWTVVATLPANATSYRDIGLTPNTRYTYMVRAKKNAGFSFSSAYASTVTADVPPPATVVTAAPAGSWAIAVSWTEDPSASYRGERSLDNGATWQSIDPVFFANYYPMTWDPTPMMWDTYRQTEQTACYRMYAYNDRGQAPASNTACTAPPAAPTDLAVTAVDDQSIGLSWADNSRVEDGYQVYYVEDDGFGDLTYYLVATLDANTTSYRVGGLASDSFYTFQVFATRDGGSSDPSNEAYAWTSVTPAAAAAVRMSRSAVPSSWRGPVSAKLGYRAGLAISRGLMMKDAQRSKPAKGRTIHQPSRKL